MPKKIVTPRNKVKHNSTSKDSLLSSVQAKKEYKRGAEAGRQAAKRGKAKRTDFSGETEFYKKGYEEKFNEISSKLTHEDIEYNRGAAAARLAAKRGKAKRTDFSGETESYKKGYEENFNENNSKLTHEKQEYNKGSNAGRMAAKLGLAKRTDFTGESESYKEGYLASYTKHRELHQTYLNWLQEEKSILARCNYLHLTCYQYPYEEDTVFFHFEEGCAGELFSCSELMQKYPTLNEKLINTYRAIEFAKYIEAQRVKKRDNIPDEAQKDQTEKITAKGSFVFIKKFAALTQLIYGKELACWMLGNSASASHYPPPPQRIIDQLVSNEDLLARTLFTEEESRAEVIESEINNRDALDSYEPLASNPNPSDAVIENIHDELVDDTDEPPKKRSRTIADAENNQINLTNSFNNIPSISSEKTAEIACSREAESTWEPQDLANHSDLKGKSDSSKRGYEETSNENSSKLTHEYIEYNRGAVAGRSAASLGRARRTNFAGKSESYKKGYEDSFNKASAKLTREDIEYNRGAEAGRQAARQGCAKRTDFAGKSEFYKKGYEEKFNEMSSKLTHEDIEYNRGAAAGWKAAWQGLDKRTDFKGKSDSYQRGYEETFAKVSSELTHEDIQYNRGAEAARQAARQGYAKRTDFAGKSESYKRGYEETFDEVSSKLTHEDIEYSREAAAGWRAAWQGLDKRTDFSDEDFLARMLFTEEDGVEINESVINNRDALEDFLDTLMFYEPLASNPNPSDVIENIQDELVDDGNEPPKKKTRRSESFSKKRVNNQGNLISYLSNIQEMDNLELENELFGDTNTLSSAVSSLEMSGVSSCLENEVALDPRFYDAYTNFFLNEFYSATVPIIPIEGEENIQTQDTSLYSVSNGSSFNSTHLQEKNYSVANNPTSFWVNRNIASNSITSYQKEPNRQQWVEAIDRGSTEKSNRPD